VTLSRNTRTIWSSSGGHSSEVWRTSCPIGSAYVAGNPVLMPGL
jgi:hypothetical protein